MSDLQQVNIPEAEFRAFAQQIAAADGQDAFNDDSLLGFNSREHIALAQGGKLIAAAVFKVENSQAECELAVLPASRQQGVGSYLLTCVQEKAVALGAQTLKVWAHLDTPAQAGFTEKFGLAPARKLYKMSANVEAALVGVSAEDLVLQPGFAIRSFDAKTDSADWVALNAEIFATHPEQGRMTEVDLRQRLAEDWASSANFLLLTNEAGQLLGYNWLKATASEAEIYVLGISPTLQGQGFGQVLLAAGLQRLTQLGHGECVLYVDAENTRAVELYATQGFVISETHTQFAKRLTES